MSGHIAESQENPFFEGKIASLLIPPVQNPARL